MPKTFFAVYEPDIEGDEWRVRIEGVDGCQAFGRSFPTARRRIREVLGWKVGSDPAALHIEDRLPSQIAAVAKRARRARREADRATARAQQEAASAAKELAELGLSRRDSAALLGLSHQRVQQLVPGGDGASSCS